MANLDHIATLLRDQFRELIDDGAGGRVSAGTLRALGVGLSYDIPDRATISTDALILEADTSTSNRALASINITMSIGIAEGFEWHDVHVVADNTNNPGEGDG